MIHSFFNKKIVSSRGAPQENDAKLRFAIHSQGIQQFHDNCKIAKCQTIATLAPVYIIIINLCLISFLSYLFIVGGNPFYHLEKTAVLQEVHHHIMI